MGSGSGGLSPGDPLGGGAARPEQPARPHYGEGPVPPGAYGPRAERPAPPRREDLAEWWRRAVAILVDGVIVGALTLGLLAALGAGFFAGGTSGIGEVVLALLLMTVLFAVIALFYAPVVMARTNGQTVGKLLTGCRVVRVDGKRVDFGYAAVREVVVKGLLLGIASSLTGGIAYVVDAAWPFVDGENRALHDYVVDSRVVRA